MASQCKRQQCTIDRRGFRQELDSWRHKLIHCVGFESILEGLLGPELVEDLKLFKDLEPTAVSDWSFDENCVFCCLRRDKVKEHLIGLCDDGLEDTPKPLLVKDQATISRLEKQAEEFLNAVLCRKDVPNFSDPHIPVVAREILQRMIRQFAAEYTSKTSPPQDSCSDSQPHSDQSLPTPPLISGVPPSTSPATTGAGPAHNQNPVLSKLLMADQDAPLDLTIKKPPTAPSDQEGVLDLSIKKNRYSSSSSSGGLSVRSPCLSPATSMLKGESPDLSAKAKDLQSTSTLEHFMAKLCPHHQRQIVDAIGFLQTEVKALNACNAQREPISETQGTACPTGKSSAVTPEKIRPELRCSSGSTPKPEVQEMSFSTPSSCAMKKVPEKAVSLKTTSPALDLRRLGSANNQTLVTPTTAPVEVNNNRHGDHAPLKMKIMTSSVAAGKKLSCVLNSSLSSHSESSENREGNSNLSNRMEAHSARLSSSVKRHNQTSHTHQARQRETVGHAKDTPTKLFSVHMTIPSDSPRTARKTIRASPDYRIRDCRGISDPDLGHCDIVFINKPITECFKEQQRGMVPRRNARKSTRGHMYSDEIWELKTVRTLAGRGNCPNPMPELITLVTPKQILSKPEGLPPVDMPFAGACRESMSQPMSTEESAESVIPGTGDMVEVAASEIDVIVETSQTDQCQSKEQSVPPSPVRPPTENKETDINAEVAQDTVADSGMTTENEESVGQAPSEAEKDHDPEPQEGLRETPEAMVAETVQSITTERAEPLFSSDEPLSADPALQQKSPPSQANQTEEVTEENTREKLEDEQPQECQPETQIHDDDAEATEGFTTTGPAVELTVKKPEVLEAVDNVAPLESGDDDDDNDADIDLTTKTLDALLKELPPWRRKKGTVIALPKRLRQTETVVVGYVNGRPISASDRSLRRRSSSSATSPNKAPVKPNQNVPSKTPSALAIHSVVENENLKKHEPETLAPVHSAGGAPAVEQAKEPSSAMPPNPTSKRASQIPKQKRPQKYRESLPVLSDQPGDGSQATESKRQLRSGGTLVSPPTSNAAASISSPKCTATPALPSTEHLPSPPLPSLLPVISPTIRSALPLASDECPQNEGPKTTVELDADKIQPVETPTVEIQKTEGESRLQAKQKLRSAKADVVDSKHEKRELSGELTIPFENQSPVKTEMQTQTMPLRSKRVLRKEAEASDIAMLLKPNVVPLEDRSGRTDDSGSSISEKPSRMPLRSESSKSETSCQPVTQAPPADNKKLALRSQRLAVPSTSALMAGERQSDLVSPIKIMPERISKAQVRPIPVSVASVYPHSSALPAITPRPEPPKHTNKFFEALIGEENQHLITNLNVKYDKMQKGWLQMDKDGQPAAKYKNKADRQAAIWKSKRRARKTKSLEHQKYSPVQMLFMKGFNLTSICRWFLESTETKSLVIVKKVNTRLPSETQLCFHSSSSASGTSQGVFPSLQAERLKKHLKKFAIASPVKSNPKSQKLIARALEQEANAVKGKEKREPPSTSQALTKSHSSEGYVQRGESQKTSGKSKNPASARILRKYSNIREKMQVQQTSVRLKEASKTLRTNSMKRLAPAKSAAKSNLKSSLKTQQKSPLPVTKQMKAAKMEKRKKFAGKKTTKHPVQERAVRAQSSSRASRDANKKELPKRCSQRLGSPKTSEKPVDASKNRVDSKKQAETEKVEADKPAVTKVSAAKMQTKESPQAAAAEIKGSENAVETPPQQSVDTKAPTSPDQVLTRSQRKMEAAVPLGQASKRVTKSLRTPAASLKSSRKADEPALTRSGALKTSAKRSQAALLPRSATKPATKRAREVLETPAKRTRTSK